MQASGIKFNQLTVMCKHIMIISIDHLSVSGDKAEGSTRRCNVQQCNALGQPSGNLPEM